VATQAVANPELGPLALKLLELGYTPQKVIAELRSSDQWSEYRQLGIVDRIGRVAAFTGEQNLDWKGHLTGENYVAMGNYLVSGAVIEAMAKAFVDAKDEMLEERLMRALEAGRDAGGERAGLLSSGLLACDNETYPRTDLRVDMVEDSQSGDAVDVLRRIFAEYKPLIPYYEQRPHNPQVPSWREWLSKGGL